MKFVLCIFLFLFICSCGKRDQSNALSTSGEHIFSESEFENFVSNIEGVESILDRSIFNSSADGEIYIQTILFRVRLRDESIFFGRDLEQEIVGRFFSRIEDDNDLITARSNSMHSLNQIVFRNSDYIGDLLIHRFSNESESFVLIHLSLK